MLAYGLTKPLRIGHYYDGNNGIYKFVMQEINSTDDDNNELGVADYYKYFPKNTDIDSDNAQEEPSTPEDDGKRKVWI